VRTVCRGIVATVALLALATGSADGAQEPQGKFGAPGTAPGRFASEQGVAFDPAGSVYVADTGNDRVQKFAPDGAFDLAFGSSGSGPGEFAQPADVAISPGGDVYVVDSGNARVQRFTADGAFLETFGTEGAAAGQFVNPSGISVSTDGDVYVADTGNDRIQVFTPDGAFIAAFGSVGSGAGQLSGPRGLAFDAEQGTIYVADTGNDRVDQFSAEGAFIASFGHSGAEALSGPRGVDFDRIGNVYVADSDHGRVVQFTADGAFAASFAEGTGPNDVAADGDGGVYVANAAASDILIFRESLPRPQVGRTANVDTVTGTVLVKPPGSGSFRRLRGSRQVLLGAMIDTTRGTVHLTASRGLKGGQQSGNFSGGQFLIKQPRRSIAAMELDLRGGNFEKCARASSRPLGVNSAGRRRGKRRRHLFANVRGHFITRGNTSTTSVRGTIWDTADYCGGTLTTVTRGLVAVRDLALRRTVLVAAGHEYFAAQPPDTARRAG
jgi:DNA-binding beta-propeller fold protein YncE